MGYEFEWDPVKAATNLRDHGVSFEEASTVFADPLAMLMAEPDHFIDEQRYVLLGESTDQRRSGDAAMSGDSMRKAKSSKEAFEDRDTMRPQCDSSRAVRGVTAVRYAQGTNIVVVDPEVRDVFPDSGTVNEVLRALAPLLREKHSGRPSRTERSSRPRPRTRSAKRARPGRLSVSVGRREGAAQFTSQGESYESRESVRILVDACASPRAQDLRARIPGRACRGGSTSHRRVPEW